MILAAGRGERLRPITDSLPKPLVEVHGKSLLERHLEHVQSAGITDVVINIDWLGDLIKERVGTGEAFGLNVTYSDETGNVLDTGGGIHKALPWLGDDPFLVINADVYTDMPVPRVQLADDHMGHLVLVPTPDYRSHGDFDRVDGLVRNGEQPEYMFGCVAIYRPEFFADCEPGRFSLVPMMLAAADAGQLSGSVYEGRWADVGTPQRLAALNQST